MDSVRPNSKKDGQSAQRVVITGATSGIGAALAVLLAQRGARLALTGRRGDRLDEVGARCREAGSAEVVPLIGSVDTDEDVRDHYGQIRSRWGGVDVAILNAGIGYGNIATEFEFEAYRATIQTNFLGVARWLEQLIPDMVAARRGVIAGMASPGGWRGFPKMGPYSASKAALITMLESVRNDLRGTGVEVVTVCPGFIKSEITDRNDPRDMPLLLSTRRGAERILEGIDRRRRLVHFPRRLTFPLRYIVGVMPAAVFDYFMQRSAPLRNTPVDVHHPDGEDAG